MEKISKGIIFSYDIKRIKCISVKTEKEALERAIMEAKK